MGLAAIEAGKAYIEMTLSDKKLNPQLNSVRAKVQGVATDLAKIGAIGVAAGGAIVGAFTAILATFASSGDELAKMSQRTHMSVEQLSLLRYAAERSGTELSVVEKAAKHLQQNGLDPLDFEKIAAEIAAIDDPVQQAQASFAAFGNKAGEAILPLLRNLPELKAKFEEFRGTSSAEAGLAEKLSDAWVDLKQHALDLTNAIASKLAPMAIVIVEAMSAMVTATVKFVDSHAVLVKSIAVVGGAILIFGAIIGGLGIAIWAVNAAVTALTVSQIALAATPLGAALLALAGTVAIGIALYTAFAGATNTTTEATKKRNKAETDLLETLKDSAGTDEQKIAAAKALTKEQLALVKAANERKAAEDTKKTATDLKRTAAIEGVDKELGFGDASSQRLATIYQQLRDARNPALGTVNQSDINGLENARDFLEYTRKQKTDTANIAKLQRQRDRLTSGRTLATDAGSLIGQGFVGAAGAGANAFMGTAGMIGKFAASADEMVGKAKESATAIFAIEDENARLRIETTKEGIDKEKALVDLDIEEKRRELKIRGVYNDAIGKALDQQQDLRKKAIDAQQGLTSRGLFNAVNLASLQGTDGPDQQTAKNTAATAFHAKRTADRLDKFTINGDTTPTFG